MEAKLRAAMAAIKGVKIPDLPKEILELDEELSHKFPNNQSLTKIIESNTKLSGEVLRLVNLPAMNCKTKISSVKEAVDNLGHDNLKNLVISAALQNLFNQPEVAEIIEHSSEVAYCCAALTEFVQGVSRDEAYLLGLFHNAGCLMLVTKDPENYPKIFSNMNSSPMKGLEQEEKLYGVNHDVIGILLAQKWKLSLDMINAILNHNINDCSTLGNERVRLMVAMTKIANYIVNEISMGSYISEEAKQWMKEACEALMISSDDVNDIRRSLG